MVQIRSEIAPLEQIRREEIASMVQVRREEITSNEQIRREQIAAVERILQRQADAARQKAIEEHKTMRHFAAAAVAIIGLVVMYWTKYNVENNVMCYSIVAIVGLVMLGVDLKLIRD